MMNIKKKRNPERKYREEAKKRIFLNRVMSLKDDDRQEKFKQTNEEIGSGES